MKGWRSNLRVVQVLLGGPDPVTRGTTGAHDTAWASGMDGRTGTIRAGDGADPVYGFRGYLAHQSTYQIPYGAARTLQRGPNIALPSTHGDVRTIGASVQDLLDRVGGRAS